MTSIRNFGAGLAAGLLALGIGAGSAFAKATPVVVKGEGTTLSHGTAMLGEIVLGIEEHVCTIIAQSGKLGENSKPKVTVGFAEAPVTRGCEGGFSVTGGLERVEIKSSGQLKIRTNPRIVITTPAMCAYEIKKLLTTLTFPKTAAVTLTAIGKRSSASSKSCAKEESLSGEVELFEAASESLVELEG